MARNFAATSHIVTTSNTATCPAAQGTVSYWFKPGFSSGSSTFRFVFKAKLSSSPNNREWGMVIGSDNNIYAGWVDFTAADFDELAVSDAGLFVSGTWAHWAMTWSDTANTIELFVNGSSVGVRSTALVTYAAGTGYSHSIGNLPSSGLGDARGDIWGYALYDSVLSAADISALAKGFAPTLVSPATLQCYVPLECKQATEIDLVSGAAWAVTSAAVAENPRVIY